MLILPREAKGLFCIEERFRERGSRGSPSLDIQQVSSEAFVVLMAGPTGLGSKRGTYRTGARRHKRGNLHLESQKASAQYWTLPAMTA